MSIFREEGETVISAELVGDCLVVVRRRKTMASFANGDPVPDRVWKEIYAADSAGLVYLKQTIEGKHYPPSRIHEKIEFPG